MSKIPPRVKLQSSAAFLTSMGNNDPGGPAQPVSLLPQIVYCVPPLRRIFLCGFSESAGHSDAATWFVGAVQDERVHMRVFFGFVGACHTPSTAIALRIPSGRDEGEGLATPCAVVEATLQERQRGGADRRPVGPRGRRGAVEAGACECRALSFQPRVRPPSMKKV